MPGKLSTGKKKAVVFIVGPTASGKTRVAAALAKKAGGEVISADSMQIYRGMKVMSQAPSPREKSGVRHHLISALDPAREYSAAMFKKSASALIKKIIARGRLPIVTGGSGLYVKALVDGLFPSPKADRAFRRRMEEFAAKRGSGELHKRLFRVDPQSAGRIHPNDRRRIIRALEIYESTGRTMSEMKAMTRGGLASKYDIKMYGLEYPRELLYARIDGRAERIIRSGAVREVARLKKGRISKTASAALGYKEISGYLDGSYDIEKAKDMLKTNTRHFARRQISWFGSDRRVRWLSAASSAPGAVARRIMMELV